VVGAILTAPAYLPAAGLRYPGVGIAVLVALPLAMRLLPPAVSPLAFGDLLAAPLAFAVGIAKLGCLLHGCCHGAPSPTPWAVALPHRGTAWFHQLEAGQITLSAAQSLPVHPLPLYFALWCAGIGAMLLAVRRHKTYGGQLLLLFLALLMAGSFAVELAKVPPDLRVRSASLALSLAASAVLVIQTRRKAQRDSNSTSTRGRQPKEFATAGSRSS
jgi:phosphatidylglycerol:prolipoprotein diacylglycerol transferase